MPTAPPPLAHARRPRSAPVAACGTAPGRRRFCFSNARTCNAALLPQHLFYISVHDFKILKNKKRDQRNDEQFNKILKASHTVRYKIKLRRYVCPAFRSRI